AAQAREAAEGRQGGIDHQDPRAARAPASRVHRLSGERSVVRALTQRRRAGMPAASAAAFAVLVAGSTAPVAVAAGSPVRPTQAVAVMLETHAARVAPRGSSAV